MTIAMERQLIAAAENGDTVKLKETLKGIPKAYIDRSVEEDDTLKTATMRAVWNGHIDVLRILSHHGVNLVGGSDGYSYLEGAVRGGHNDTVKYIINEAKYYSHSVIVRCPILKSSKTNAINDAVRAAADTNRYDIVHYLIEHCDADIKQLTEEQYIQYQSFLGYTVIRHPEAEKDENKGMFYDNDLRYQALEQACEYLGMDSHIVVIKSKKDCITDADKKAYGVMGKPFAVKRSYLNCNSLDATFFYNNEGKRLLLTVAMETLMTARISCLLHLKLQIS